MSDTVHPPATPYDRVGGAAGVRRLVARFYALMDTLPEAAAARAVHAADLGPNFGHLIGAGPAGQFGGERNSRRPHRDHADIDALPLLAIVAGTASNEAGCEEKGQNAAT